MQLMTTFSGNKKNLQNLKQFLREYNLENKKLVEFTELDNAIYRDIKAFVKII